MARIPKGLMAQTVYLLHHGAEGNSAYGMFASPPRVSMRMVLSETTRRPTPCYESPDSMLFNFCRTGTEHGLGLRLPLGSYIPVKFEPVGEMVSLDAKEG